MSASKAKKHAKKSAKKPLEGSSAPSNQGQKAGQPSGAAAKKDEKAEADSPPLGEIVLGLLKTLKPPVHIGVLSIAYKTKTGRSIKDDYKGGMLRFIKTELAQSVVIMGEGNDTFVRVATPAGRASHWIKECVRTNGPILASMVGRLYHEATGTAFNAALPDAGGIIKFMRTALADDLSFEAQKGQEVLVDMQQRIDGPRAFLKPGSKKQRKEVRKAEKLKRKREEEEAEDEEEEASGDEAVGGGEAKAGDARRAATDAADVAGGGVGASVASGGRLGARGLVAAYSVPTERLLLLGEADFSFAAALCAPPHMPEGSSLRRRLLTATSFDERPTLRTKYGENIVDRHLRRLKSAGATVTHGVDATSIANSEEIASRGPFDTIAILFPHVGGASGLHNSIDENRSLLRGLLTEAPKVLAAGGEVHVTLVHRFPYTAWLNGLMGQPATPTLGVGSSSGYAKGAGGGSQDTWTLPEGLAYAGAVPFEFEAFSGYQHRATSKVENESAGALEVGTRCLTHVWRSTSTAAVAAPPASTIGSSAEAGAGEASSSPKKKKKRPNNKKRAKRVEKDSEDDGGSDDGDDA